MLLKIAANYPGRCSACTARVPFAKGDVILWDRSTRECIGPCCAGAASGFYLERRGRQITVFTPYRAARAGWMQHYGDCVIATFDKTGNSHQFDFADFGAAGDSELAATRAAAIWLVSGAPRIVSDPTCDAPLFPYEDEADEHAAWEAWAQRDLEARASDPRSYRRSTPCAETL